VGTPRTLDGPAELGAGTERKEKGKNREGKKQKQRKERRKVKGQKGFPFFYF
jgi:hypothetical protein